MRNLKRFGIEYYYDWQENSRLTLTSRFTIMLPFCINRPCEATLPGAK
jgi:hypothetical protein